MTLKEQIENFIQSFKGDEQYELHIRIGNEYLKYFIYGKTKCSQDKLFHDLQKKISGVASKDKAEVIDVVYC